MDPMPERSSCAPFADDLGALAAGSLTGRERSAVLVHVERCPDCTAELESLSASADALLRLFPEVEPPPGFAERVVERISRERRVERRPRTRAVMAVAAAVVALGLGAGLTFGLRSPDGSAPAPRVVTAALQSPGGSAGSVSISSDDGGWLVMTLNDRSATRTVTCRIVLTDGSTRTVGHFTVERGYGTWSVALHVPPSSIHAVKVIGEDGSVLGSATIRSPGDST